jgi:hypothetical protein
MHEGSADSATSDEGSTHLDIPLGQRTTTSISVAAPSSGTSAVLALQSSKGGGLVFRDDGEPFDLQ